MPESQAAAAMNMLSGLAHQAADAMQGAVDAVEGAVEAVTGAAAAKAFTPIVKKVVTEALDQLGDKVGDQVSKKMREKYPVLDKVDAVPVKAKELADKAVEASRPKVMDFLEDCVEDLEGTLPKIGTLLLRSIKKACDDAVDGVLDLIPSCCGCLAGKKKADDVKEACYNSLVQGLKDDFKAKAKSPGGGISVPDAIVSQITPKLDDMVDKFDINQDPGEPKNKSAPQPQTMGQQQA